MAGGLITSQRLAALLGVLKAAKGRPLTNGEIIRRLAKRGVYTPALHSDIADLRRDPNFAALGWHIPPAEVVVERDAVTGAARRRYTYRMLPLGEK